jgi:hypothetical protein
MNTPISREYTQEHYQFTLLAYHPASPSIHDPDRSLQYPGPGVVPLKIAVQVYLSSELRNAKIWSSVSLAQLSPPTLAPVMFNLHAFGLSPRLLDVRPRL